MNSLVGDFMKISKQLFWGNMPLYEYDIEYCGGRVEYTGKVLAKSWRRSWLEEAIVTYENNTCHAQFERFPFGNAALHGFTCNGKPVAAIENSMASAIWDGISKKQMESPHYMEFELVRRVKQYCTGFLQFLCIVIAVISLWNILFFDGAGQYIFTLGCATFVFFFFGLMYKYYRCVRPEQYTPRFFGKLGR